jgi:hypothetical protein
VFNGTGGEKIFLLLSFFIMVFGFYGIFLMARRLVRDVAEVRFGLFS